MGDNLKVQGVKKRSRGHEDKKWHEALLFYFCQILQVMHFPMIYNFPTIYWAIADIKNDLYRLIRDDLKNS